MNNKNQLDQQQNFPVTTNNFEEYLKNYGLPYTNIIATEEERAIIKAILPTALSNIPNKVKREATYMSKFVASSSIGLYDASLNYLWDAVMLNIYKKIVTYGLNIFFDEAVKPDERSFYNSKEQLHLIKDATILDTCKKMEIIDKISYLKLKHILDMRNAIGASHPNDYVINSYELISYLETCVKLVLSSQPSADSLKVKKFLGNLRKSDDQEFNEETLETIKNLFKNLPTTLCSSIMKAIFGMYVESDLNNIVKLNIIHIAPVLWSNIKEAEKYSLGDRYLNYKNNLDKQKAELAYKFIESCDGLTYLDDNIKTIKINNLAQELYELHYNWDNYIKEASKMKQIFKFIKKSSDIPDASIDKLIHSVLVCAIGKPHVTYNNGVSPAGEAMFNDFFSLLNDNQVNILLNTIYEYKDNLSLENAKNCQENSIKILSKVNRDLLNSRTQEKIDYLLQNNNINIYQKLISKDFKTIL